MTFYHPYQSSVLQLHIHVFSFHKSVICTENTFQWNSSGFYCTPNKAALQGETSVLSYFVPNLLQINAINHLCTCLLFLPVLFTLIRSLPVLSCDIHFRMTSGFFPHLLTISLEKHVILLALQIYIILCKVK